MTVISFKPADIAMHTSSISILSSSVASMGSSVTDMGATVNTLSSTVSVLDATAIKSSTASGEERITNFTYDTAAEQLKVTTSTA